MSRSDRSEFLDRVCDGDEELRRRVEANLAVQPTFLSDDCLSDDESALEETEMQSDKQHASGVDELSFAMATPAKNGKTLDERLRPNDMVGVYRLERLVGQGGMGEVWKAVQTSPFKRDVALKVIKQGSGTREILARFEGERQALALMNHPNIAGILDAGTTEQEQPFFAMELVEGDTLCDYCDSKKLGVVERIRLFREICGAVHHAHQKGIIHRDLKPSNILVTEGEDGPIPKVIDFGLAKAFQNDLKLTQDSVATSIGQVLGTIKYMSPEQTGLEMLDVDTSTDVYSLGVVLYELLTGRAPLDDETLRGQPLLDVLKLVRFKEAMRPSEKVRSKDPEAQSSIARLRSTDVSKLNRVLQGDLDWIVMKAVDKERHRRYKSVSEFSNDLRRLLDGDAVEARPPSRTYRIGKFVRKNRSLVSTVGAVFVALLAGIAGTTWFAIKADKLQKSEKELRQIAESRSEEAVRLQKLESEARNLAERRLTESLAGLGDLELQRGRLPEAVSAFKQAIDNGHLEKADLQLQIVEANFSMLQYDQAANELKMLEGLELSDSQTALKTFFEGLLDKAGTEKIEKAIEIGLPEGYNDMARACVAETLGEMQTNAKQAVEKLPFNSNARRILFCSSMLRGDADEMRKQALVINTLSPEDYSVDIVLAILETDDEKAKRHVSSLPSQALTKFENLISSSRKLLHADKQSKGSNPIADAMKIPRLASAFTKVFRELKNGSNSMFSTPIFRVPSINSLVKKYTAGSSNMVFRFYKQAKEDFKEVNQQLGIGDSLYFEAYATRGLLETEEDEQKRKELMIETVELTDKALAAQYNLQFDAIRSAAMFTKLECHYQLWLDYENEDHKRKAIETLQQLADRLARPEEDFYKLDDYGVGRIVDMAVGLERADLARSFSRIRLKRFPKSRDAKIAAAAYAHQDRDYFRSLNLIKELADSRLSKEQKKLAAAIEAKVKSELIEKTKGYGLWPETKESKTEESKTGNVETQDEPGSRDDG